MWTCWPASWATGAHPVTVALLQGLADGIRMLIIDGRLPVGARLPSERALADTLRVSRTTVTAAYTQLREDGYLNARRGARSTTALPVAPGASPAAIPARVNLAHAALSAPAAVRDGYIEATHQMTPYLHDVIDVTGLAPLREAIAERYCGEAFPPTRTKSWSRPARCTQSA